MHQVKSVSLCGALLVLVGASPVLAKVVRPPVSFGQQVAALSTVDHRVLPAVDNATLIAEAVRHDAESFAAPMTFAHAFAAGFDLTNSGTWETLADGSRLWRLRIESPGARHLNLGYSRFDLPEGAELWVYNRSGDDVEGAYTASDRSHNGRLFTPIVYGDQVVIELHVPADAKGPLTVQVGSVNHGFRAFEKNHGVCNVDVVCPEGDPWRDQIRSVGFYSINGFGICSGQLVNNTAQDDTPYFLSAFHCGINAANDDSLVFYWNYEAPVCGQQSGGSLADHQSGAIFRASEPTSDFLLLELSHQPDPDSDVYYSGWDASGATPQGSVGIHHPQTDVKSISFNDDPLTKVDIGSGGVTHWQVDEWEKGTTEPGSSGSCLWDPTTKLCVGVLTGGFASCEVIDSDFFGMLNVGWDAGSTPETRLRDWLDPISAGAMSLEGKNPGGAMACRPSPEVLCLRNRRFEVGITQGGVPATVAPGQSSQSGNFYFFNPNNWETLVKVLDGCALNNHYWVFAAGATNVEWTLTVTDTASGASQEYVQPPGRPSPAITDTSAFATCP